MYAKKYISINEIDGFKNEFENFLTKKGRSKSNANKARTYRGLLKGRFKLTNVERIENTDYEHSIFGKGADFTSKSIRDLIKNGEKDALKWLNNTRNNNEN